MSTPSVSATFYRPVAWAEVSSYGSYTNPTYAYDGGYNDTTTFSTILDEDPDLIDLHPESIKYIWDINANATSNVALYVTHEFSDGGEMDIYAWNHSTNFWYLIYWSLLNDTLATRKLTIIPDYINSSGGIEILVEAHWCGCEGNNTNVSLYDIYIEIPTIETAPPKITIHSPPNETIPGNTTLLNVSIDKIGSIWYSLDGGANETGCTSCYSFERELPAMPVAYPVDYTDGQPTRSNTLSEVTSNDGIYADLKEDDTTGWASVNFSDNLFETGDVISKFNLTIQHYETSLSGADPLEAFYMAGNNDSWVSMGNPAKGTTDTNFSYDLKAAGIDSPVEANGLRVRWAMGSAGPKSITTNVDYFSIDYDTDPSMTVLSDGPHNITVYANNTAGNLNSSTVYFTVDANPQNITYYNISLIPGWNMISIPLEQDNWSISSVLASIEGNYTDIYAYVNGMWYWDTSLLPFFKLTDMAIENGYWINMSTAETLELSGTLPLSTTINVVPKWNLVGYPSFATQNITTVLPSIGYTDVYTYKNGMWYWDTSLLPFFVLTEMTTGQGYWINATGTGSYDVGN